MDDELYRQVINEIGESLMDNNEITNETIEKIEELIKKKKENL